MDPGARSTHHRPGLGSPCCRGRPCALPVEEPPVWLRCAGWLLDNRRTSNCGCCDLRSATAVRPV